MLHGWVIKFRKLEYRRVGSVPDSYRRYVLYNPVPTQMRLVPVTLSLWLKAAKHSPPSGGKV